MRPKAVIFDYGEVLSAPANPEAHAALLKIAGLPETTLDQQYWAFRLEYDAGLTGNEYWDKVAHGANRTFTPEQSASLIECDARMWMDLNEPMVAWAAQVGGAGVRTGILSNMGFDTLRAIRSRFAWLKRFDACTWSCELGIVKPDPRIYAEIVRKLDVRPEEALFLDNLEHNVQGAKAAGLESIVFRDIEQLGEDLRRAGIDLPAPQALAAL